MNLLLNLPKQPQEILFHIPILTPVFISDPKYKSAMKKHYMLIEPLMGGKISFIRVLTEIVARCIPLQM
jgi:hypothetical protein